MMIQMVIQVMINDNTNYNRGDDTSGNTKDDKTENTRNNKVMMIYLMIK